MRMINSNLDKKIKSNNSIIKKKTQNYRSEVDKKSKINKNWCKLNKIFNKFNDIFVQLNKKEKNFLRENMPTFWIMISFNWILSGFILHEFCSYCNQDCFIVSYEASESSIFINLSQSTASVTTYRETASRYMQLVSLNSQSFTPFLGKFTKRHESYFLIILIIYSLNYVYHSVQNFKRYLFVEMYFSQRDYSREIFFKIQIR